MRSASPGDALREVFAGEVLLGRSTISPAAWLTATRHRRRRSRGALRRGSDHDPAKALLLDGLPERKAVSSPSLDSRVDRHAELDRALSIASRDGIVTAVLRVSSASKLSSARMAKQVSRAAYPSDLLVATHEAQHAVHWAVVGVDQPGVPRSYECGARNFARGRPIRRPANFECRSATVPRLRPALRGTRARRSPGAGRVAAAGAAPRKPRNSGARFGGP